MPEYYKIGKLVATHGLKGEVILKHSLGKKTSLKGLEVLFIEETKDNFFPYFIQSSTIKKDDETLIKFEGMDTKETAKKLVPKEAWLTEEEFKKYAAKSAPISLLGYNLINEKISLGKIVEVIEQPHQLLCAIILNGKEALIPIHEQSLKKIDKKKQEVHVVLPDGLLDVYQ